VGKNLIIKSHILTPFLQYGLNDEEYRLPGIPTIRWMGKTNTGVPYMNCMLSNIKSAEERQSSFPLWALVKGIARAFN
jgi:hypothetical protein